MLRHTHFYTKGGLPTFAAHANSQCDLKKADAQGGGPFFSLAQLQRRSAESPNIFILAKKPVPQSDSLTMSPRKEIA
jgi:hypothetical protein